MVDWPGDNGSVHYTGPLFCVIIFKKRSLHHAENASKKEYIRKIRKSDERLP
jgi:hypothetical protein